MSNQVMFVEEDRDSDCGSSTTLNPGDIWEKVSLLIREIEKSKVRVTKGGVCL